MLAVFVVYALLIAGEAEAEENRAFDLAFNGADVQRTAAVMAECEVVERDCAGLHIDGDLCRGCGERIRGCVVADVLDVDILIALVSKRTDAGYAAAEVFLLIAEAGFIEGNVLFGVALYEHAVVLHHYILRLAAPLLCPVGKELELCVANCAAACITAEEGNARSEGACIPRRCGRIGLDELYLVHAQTQLFGGDHRHYGVAALADVVSAGKHDGVALAVEANDRC